MSKRDLGLVVVIGGAVGLLAQPILANFVEELHNVVPAPIGVIRGGAFLFFVLLAPVALFLASLLGRVLPVLYQFAKFAAVGSLNSFVDLGVLNLATFLWGTIPSTGVFALFKAISFLAATTNSFFWNKYWTFGAAARPEAGEVAKFYGIAVAGGVVNVGVATLVKAVAPVGVSPNALVNLVAPLAGMFAALLWNFLGYKFFVFRKPPAP